MLTFVDTPKVIRVVRAEMGPDGIVRTPLGRISKSTFEIDEALGAQLTRGERDEINQIVTGYSDMEPLEKRFYALTLPVILRKTMEYLETDATELESKFILAAITEALRRMRRHERNQEKEGV